MTELDTMPLLDAETRVADAPEGHKAELRLWLRLLACAALTEGELRSRLRNRFEVTLPRFDAMAQLERAPAGMTLGELSRRMMVTNGNVTGLVERLTRQRLLERVPHPGDRRSAYVRLSAAGQRSFAQMARAHAEWVAELFEGLSPQEVAQLMRLLGKLKQSVRAGIERRDDAA